MRAGREYGYTVTNVTPTGNGGGRLGHTPDSLKPFHSRMTHVTEGTETERLPRHAYA